MLSTTADYALRIMVVLSDRVQDRVAVAESTAVESRPIPVAMTSELVANQTGVPADYAVKVLQTLARAGLVKAQRGRNGGFSIVGDPAEISLLDVVNAIDPIGEVRLARAVDNADGNPVLPLHQRLNEVVHDVNRRLGSMTLAGIAAG